jgi:hypothetical protein
MRAIFIDSNDRNVYEARIKGNDFREICSLIGCNIITGGYSFENGDYMYVDDEAIFTTNRNGFIISVPGNSWGAQQLIGNALIIGSSKDDDGSDADAVSSIEEIKNLISFKTFI